MKTPLSIRSLVVLTVVASVFLITMLSASSQNALAQANKKSTQKVPNKSEVPPKSKPSYRMAHDKFLEKIGVDQSKECKRLYFTLVKMENTVNWPPLLFKVYKGYKKKCEKEIFGPARRSRIPTNLAGQWYSVRPVLIRMKKSKRFRKWLLQSIAADTPLIALQTIRSKARGDCPKGFKRQCSWLDNRVGLAMKEGRDKGLIQIQSE